jgi:hypothetical protein
MEVEMFKKDKLSYIVTIVLLILAVVAIVK